MTACGGEALMTNDNQKPSGTSLGEREGAQDTQTAAPAPDVQNVLSSSSEGVSADAFGEEPLDDDGATRSELEASSEGPDDPASVPPEFGHWLVGGLRPSPSKSVPPPAEPATAAQSPETLAPQVLATDHLDEEDLAVLPRSVRARGQGWPRKLAPFAALVALLALTFVWWTHRPNAVEEPERASATTQPGPAPTLSEGQSNPDQTPAAPADSASVADETPYAPRLHGAWRPPSSTAEPDTAAPESLPGGPSVGRLPDLPAEYWSRLRQQEREKKAARTSIAAPPLKSP